MARREDDSEEEEGGADGKAEVVQGEGSGEVLGEKSSDTTVVLEKNEVALGPWAYPHLKDSKAKRERREFFVEYLEKAKKLNDDRGLAAPEKENTTGHHTRMANLWQQAAKATTVGKHIADQAQQGLYTMQFASRPDAKARMVCFAWTGASALVYRSWHEAFPEFDIIAVQLPGRMTRAREEPLDSILVMAERVATALQVTGVVSEQDDEDGVAVIFFGHSHLGSLLAFETARALWRERRKIAHLIVSGCPSPRAVADANKYGFTRRASSTRDGGSRGGTAQSTRGGGTAHSSRTPPGSARSGRVGTAQSAESAASSAYQAESGTPPGSAKPGSRISSRARSKRGSRPATSDAVPYPKMSELKYPALLEHVQRLGGMPPEFFQQPELFRLFVPLMRADARAVDSYEYEEEEVELDSDDEEEEFVKPPTSSHGSVRRQMSRRSSSVRPFSVGSPAGAIATARSSSSSSSSNNNNNNNINNRGSRSGTTESRSRSNLTSTAISGVRTGISPGPSLRGEESKGDSENEGPELTMEQKLKRKRFPIPILALCGDDDHMCRSEDLEGWATETGGDFVSYVIPGGHFYFLLMNDNVTISQSTVEDATDMLPPSAVDPDVPPPLPDLRQMMFTKPPVSSTCARPTMCHLADVVFDALFAEDNLVTNPSIHEFYRSMSAPSPYYDDNDADDGDVDDWVRLEEPGGVMESDEYQQPNGAIDSFA